MSTVTAYYDEYAARSAYETMIGEANVRKQQEELVAAPQESIEEFLAHDPVAIREASAQAQAAAPEGPPEEPSEDTREDTGECPVPMTMAAVARMVNRPGWRGRYDFGMYSVPKAPGGSRVPTGESSMRAMEINMLFCVARALCVREICGKSFSADEVKASVVESWVRNSQLRKYREVIVNDPALSARAYDVLNEVSGFIDGKVPAAPPKYLVKYSSQKWSVASLVLHMAKSRRIPLRKFATKKGKKRAC